MSPHISVYLSAIYATFRALPCISEYDTHMSAKRAKVEGAHGEVLARRQLHLVAPGDVITTDIGFMRFGSARIHAFNLLVH